jgi:membrane peptidoglycan carboxypeptidase
VRQGGCVNLATQGMFQPGSSFKPYVLAAAEGSQTAGILTRMNGPAVLPDPPGPDVHNDSGEVCNDCPLDKALALSINTIFVPLAKQTGVNNVATTAHQAGIPESVPLSDAGLTTDRIALGVYPVHPIDQAVGYGTLCNGGRQVTPFIVRSVKTRKGDSLYTSNPHATLRIQPAVAADLTYAMQQVVTGGTAKAAALGNRPVAGKTGTTQNNTNAWFIGCTGPAKNNGQLVTAVWVGHAATVTPLTDIPGFQSGVFGGTLPAQIFQQFMTQAMNGKPVVQFPPPAYYAGPKAPSTVSPSPTTPSATPTPSKTSASPKPTKTKPATTSAAPTTTAAPVTTTSAAPTASAAPPPSQAPPTTTAAPPPASGPPAAGAGVTSPAAAGASVG